MTNSWEQDLTAAFSVLLDRPVEGFGPEADYALYYINGAVDDRWLWEALADAESLRCRPGTTRVAARDLAYFGEMRLAVTQTGP
ncbi:hypothetical protein [Streptomyces sp. CB02009]|uniref:hypothetical protein n=1 Tax=Streptomyces sp. CB02009 TaxID=1703938 RepID=UPI001161228D|nr:hypothetical protein [Streptomyces sp. CB02009]